ncbi:hypothetical protein BD626DRAFT_105388 [Schizophyllum amplum]|uniref:Uncharacterized protein n=1 Tax=Schizophyllum amplum TaxID=97359 RepID=A0A550CSJ6_9AGAR|nr:hypothetical protein BD626DRAFT_105388 [Auriculariopsis ampla]
MRRIASVFSKRDKDAQSSASASTAGRSSTNLSIKPRKSFKRTQSQTLTLVPPLHAPPPIPAASTPALLSDPTHSSASSSGGSSFLQTPEDELLIFPPTVVTPDSTPRRKSWMPWVSKHPGIARQEKPGASDHHPGLRRLLPPLGNRPSMDDDESDDDSSEDSEDEEPSDADPVPHRQTTAPTRAFAPASAAAALDYLTAITQRQLDGKPCPLSPFVLDSTCPAFPCSTNRAPTRSHATLRIRMHRQHILARTKSTGRAVTRAEEASILPFSARPSVTFTPSEAPDDLLDRRPPRGTRVLPYSPGIRRWIARPTFEERHTVYLANGRTIETYGVSCAWAVAALEYSEALDAMAGYDLITDELPTPEVGFTIPELTLAGVSSPSASPSAMSSTGSSSHVHVPNRKSLPGKPPPPLAPSPLRHETDATPASSAVRLVQPSPVTNTVDSSEATAANLSFKRGVHFAEDNKDDVVPLAYVLRARQRKAEKARFLREEQEKRKAEIDRMRVENERRAREKERAEWERERQAWEREKRAMEEERKKRLYQEEVIASRQRRENQRYGHQVTPSPSSSTMREGESTQRESSRHIRPAYDSSSRHASESKASRPASIVAPSPAPSPRPASTHSRPPSTYSVSSEDVRPRGRSATAPQPERASSFPTYASTYAGSRSSLLMPPMPSMPSGMMTPGLPPNMMGMPMMVMPGMPPMPMTGMPYAMDMPLLPPSAPFMMHSSRSRSRSSRDSSPGSSPGSSSPARSRERLGSSPRPPSTVGSQWAPSHERRASDERSAGSRLSQGTMGSKRMSGLQSQPASVSRGRAKHPNAAPPLPSPWTALPMQQPSTVPVTMPAQKPRNNRRSTMFA